MLNEFIIHGVLSFHANFCFELSMHLATCQL